MEDWDPGASIPFPGGKKSRRGVQRRSVSFNQSLGGCGFQSWTRISKLPSLGRSREPGRGRAWQAASARVTEDADAQLHYFKRSDLLAVGWEQRQELPLKFECPASIKQTQFLVEGSWRRS